MIVPTTVSLFCGAGGESLGKERAFEELGLATQDMKAYAMNHWNLAVATHKLNLPWVHVRQEEIEEVTAADFGLCGKTIQLLWASPSCVHFSRARGGKPLEDQQRSHAWEVLNRWLRMANVEVFLLENVNEFRTWGPIYTEHAKGCHGNHRLRKGRRGCLKRCRYGKPILKRKGEFFSNFVQGLRDLGYEVEWRTLCAADYGDPTTRKRLFLQAVKDGRGIHWPEATHRNPKDKDADQNLEPWVPAHTCIDWGIKCPSIFDRKKPLAEATCKRIAAGIVRHVLNGKPFIVNLTHGGRVEDLDEPLKTITGANRGEKAMVAPVLAHLQGSGDSHTRASNDSVEEPLRTMTAGRKHHGLVAANLLNIDHRSVRENDRSVEEPLSTATTKARHALVSAFIARHFGGPNGNSNDGTPMHDPMPTVTTKGQNGVVAVSLMTNNSNNAPHSVEKPFPTITTGDHRYLVAAFINHYYSTGGVDQSAEDPMHTVTTKSRHGLVTVEIDGETYVIRDIGMRMLQPHELAAAMSFPPWYRWEIDGKPLAKKDQIKMIGNAVPIRLAAALVKAVVITRPKAFGLLEDAA